MYVYTTNVFFRGVEREQTATPFLMCTATVSTLFSAIFAGFIFFFSLSLQATRTVPGYPFFIFLFFFYNHFLLFSISSGCGAFSLSLFGKSHLIWANSLQGMKVTSSVFILITEFSRAASTHSLMTSTDLASFEEFNFVAPYGLQCYLCYFLSHPVYFMRPVIKGPEN